MCDGGDYPPDFLREERRRARKQHRCCECGFAIPPGTTYVYTSGSWDGSFSTFKQHPECRQLLGYISDAYCGGESWNYGSLYEEIGEYTDEPDDDGSFYWGTALACRMAAIEARYDR